MTAVMEATMVKVADVVFDESIYPRSEHSQATVDRYADALEAGDVFPPIILEPGTNRLWDGFHRWSAHKQSGRGEVAVEWRELPEKKHPKMFAASFSVKHGDRIDYEDLCKLAQSVLRSNPDYDQVDGAADLGVSKQTMSKWCSDITKEKRLLRAAKAQLLYGDGDRGWSQRRIAEALGITQPTVIDLLKVELSDHLTEPYLREVIADLPTDHGLDIEETVDRIVYAELEAQLKIKVTEGRPDLAAAVEDPTVKHPANYRQAYELWGIEDAAEKAKREKERRLVEEKQKEDQARVERGKNRVQAFLSGYDQAYSMAQGMCPDREQVLSALQKRERERFELIERETTWPTARPL